jgi:hypothetical protein
MVPLDGWPKRYYRTARGCRQGRDHLPICRWKLCHPLHSRAHGCDSCSSSEAHCEGTFFPRQCMFLHDGFFVGTHHKLLSSGRTPSRNQRLLGISWWTSCPVRGKKNSTLNGSVGLLESMSLRFLICQLAADMDVPQKIAARFPTVARMARDFLAIPGTSVSVERTFSKSRHICTDLRSSLKAPTIQQALLTKAWIRSGLFEMNPPVEKRRKHGDNGCTK